MKLYHSITEKKEGELQKMKIVKDKIKIITKEAKWTSWAELKALSEAGKLGECGQAIDWSAEK